ncbi:MAG: AMP-binding protein, partial [bacterium]
MRVPRISTRLVDQADRDPDRPFVLCPDGELSFGQMVEMAARGAGFLQSLGARRGDRVVTMLGNTVEAAVAFFACAHAGIAIVPLNPQHRGELLRQMVSNVQPAVCIFDPALVDEAQQAELQVAAPRSKRVANVLAIARSSDPAPMSTSAEDVLAIMYTSGTTGRSKGAVIGHPSFLATAAAYNETVEPRSDDVYFTTLPLFHGNALAMSLCGALDAGVSLAVTPKFSASGFFDQARRAGATVTNVLGVMAPILLKTYEDPVRDHRLRMFIGGGMPIDQIKLLERRFGISYRELFGLTETGITAGNRGSNMRAGSFGKPYSHVEMRIVPERKGVDTGEIQVRAIEPDVLLREYWRDPEGSAMAFVDGWFKTGDRGSVDREGFFYFKGRIKDSIRRRGENISPGEVEAVVNALPG